MNFATLTNEQWLDAGLSLAILVLALFLARPVINFILNRIIKRLTGATKTILDDKIIDAVRPPLVVLVILLAFQYAVDRLDFIQEMLSFNVDDVYFVLYFMVGFGVVWRLSLAVIDWYVQEVAPRTESNLDNQLLPFLRRVFMIILAVIALIILLGHFNIEVSGIVTTLGIGSLAIALAAQAALSDTISGFLIMLDRPFRIGDRVQIQDLNTWGDIIDIGLRSTNIRTRDNRMVIIPNSVLAKSLVVNYSYPDSQYRIQIELGVAYGSDVEQVRQIIIDTVQHVEGVLPDKKVQALFLRFGDSALIFRVRWWIESYTDTRVMFDAVNSAIYNVLNEAGIELPFPQRDLHLKIDSEDQGQFEKVLGR